MFMTFDAQSQIKCIKGGRALRFLMDIKKSKSQMFLFYLLKKPKVYINMGICEPSDAFLLRKLVSWQSLFTEPALGSERYAKIRISEKILSAHHYLRTKEAEIKFILEYIGVCVLFLLYGMWSATITVTELRNINSTLLCKYWKKISDANRQQLV